MRRINNLRHFLAGQYLATKTFNLFNQTICHHGVIDDSSLLHEQTRDTCTVWFDFSYFARTQSTDTGESVLLATLAQSLELTKFIF